MKACMGVATGLTGERAGAAGLQLLGYDMKNGSATSPRQSVIFSFS